MFGYFSKIVSFIADSSVSLPGEKLKIIFQGLVFSGFFILFFIFIYYKYSKNYPELRRLFWGTTSILFLIIIAKYGIYHFGKGYIPDRLLFYAVPSPKAEGVIWFFIIIAIFTVFLLFRKKIEALPTIKFLLASWIVFTTFSLSVSAIREGTFSIYEPFTRTHWEYTGNLSLIKNTHDFLSNYETLRPQFAEHSKTHPPGYTLVLYFFQKLGAGLLAMSILVVMLGGLVIFPLYFLLRKFADEDTVRRGLEIFIFFPSFVMFSATSMEVVFLFSVWLAMTILYIGWGRSIILSFAGGVLAAFALFQNFLFLSLMPLLILFLYEYLKVKEQQKIVLQRMTASFMGFLSFYGIIYLLTGYSIINDFFVANSAQQSVVQTTSSSILIYLLFSFINIFAFIFYLGLANIVLLFRQKLGDFFKNNKLLVWPGFIMVFIFIVTGLFQGEVERIWIFLTPFFILLFGKLSPNNDDFKLPAVISLLFFQIVVMQILFYTYW